MPDEITLTIPRHPEFHRVAHLVLGGLATRMNLTLENLEDMTIAIDSILDRAEPEGDVTVVICLREDELETRVGPVDLGRELDHEAGAALDLRRVLNAVVDDVSVDGEWVKLTKKVQAGG
jgi:hypothetical protein